MHKKKKAWARQDHERGLLLIPWTGHVHHGSWPNTFVSNDKPDKPDDDLTEYYLAWSKSTFSFPLPKTQRATILIVIQCSSRRNHGYEYSTRKILPKGHMHAHTSLEELEGRSSFRTLLLLLLHYGVLLAIGSSVGLQSRRILFGRP